MSRWVGRSLRTAWVVIVVAVALSGRAFGQTPAEVAEFERQLAVAANSGDTAALTNFSVGATAERFAWTTGRSAVGSSGGRWNVKILADPGPAPDPADRWVTFSRYQKCESQHDHIYRLAAGDAGLRLGDEIPETEIGGYRVRHHDVSVRFHVAAKSATFKDRVTIERRPGAWRTMLLRLNSPYQVTSVKCGAQPVPFARAGGFLAVRAPEGPRIVLDMAYGGVVDGHTEDYILADHAGLTSYWYPHTGRLPVTSRIAITAPKGWQSIAIGKLVSREVQGGVATTTYESDLAVCYLTVASGDYHITTRTVDGVAVSAYLLKDDPARGASVANVAKNALSWFSHNFSPYPFKTYVVVESRVFPAALECYSFTLCGSSTIPEAVPHEISHTWWGGVVPNTYTRSLWNESFATYSDSLYRRSTGEDGISAATATTEMMATVATGYSLLDASDAMDFRQASVGYGKGGAVLRELERMLGKEKMLASIRRFIADHKAGEDAEWLDYIKAVSETAGQEWSGFFTAWLSRKDLPELRLENATAAASGGGYVVRGTVGFKSAPFWIATPVSVSTAGGDVKATVMVKGAPTAFEVKTTSKPTRVRVDPARELLRKSAATNYSPTLATMHTASAPLLIVYATGGTPEAAASARFAATTPGASLFVFATLTVKADTEVTEADLDASSVLLVGRPEDLRVPASWTAKCPLKADSESIGAGSNTWRGADLWGLAVLPHPNRANSFVAYALGTGPEALRGFTRQGNLDTDQSLFVVGGDGKPLAQRKAAATYDTEAVLDVP